MNSAKQMCHLFKLLQSQRIANPVHTFFACKPYNIFPARQCSAKQQSLHVVEAANHSASSSDPLPAESDTGDTSVEFGEVDINRITGGDEALERKYKIILLEVDVMRQEGIRVPSRMNVREWKDLLELKSRSARMRYLTFLFKREMKRVNEQRKKEEKRVKYAEFQESKKTESPDSENSHLEYGLGKNSFFMRFRDSTINDWYNWKLMQAIMFSQEIVVDCGYDKHMTSREAANCGKQLGLLFAEHRLHVEPFNLHFCNVQREGRTMQAFHKIIPICYDSHFPLNITEESYLDIFPKERLVYLTPHCRQELREYDHDAVYIIGALVDKVNSKPLSLARAKEEGLKMAKLPLDKYLQWGQGSGKSLTLNQMIRIMLDIRHTGDWVKALRHVPVRKLIEYAAKRTERLQRDRIQYKLFE